MSLNIPGEWTYRGLTFTERHTQEMLENITSTEFRDDDLLIAAFPKSGTSDLPCLLVMVTHW